MFSFFNNILTYSLKREDYNLERKASSSLEVNVWHHFVLLFLPKIERLLLEALKQKHLQVHMEIGICYLGRSLKIQVT